MAQVEPTAPHCLIQGEENTSKVVCIRKHEVINSAESSMIGPKSEPDQILYVATQREGEERQNELVCRREKAKTKRRTGKLMITEGATLHKPTDKEVTRQKKVYLNGEQKL